MSEESKGLNYYQLICLKTREWNGLFQTPNAWVNNQYIEIYLYGKNSWSPSYS